MAKIFRALTFLMAFLTLVMCVIYYSEIPEEIPIHFNYKGEADGFGPKSSMLISLGVLYIIIIGIDVLGRFPKYFNYPVAITEKNKEAQQKNAKAILQQVNFGVALLAFFFVYRYLNIEFAKVYEGYYVTIYFVVVSFFGLIKAFKY